MENEILSQEIVDRVKKITLYNYKDFRAKTTDKEFVEGIVEDLLDEIENLKEEIEELNEEYGELFREHYRDRL